MSTAITLRPRETLDVYCSLEMRCCQRTLSIFPLLVLWTLGPLDSATCGIFRDLGLLDFGTRLLDCWTLGLLDFGILDFGTGGFLDSGIFGLLDFGILG